MILTSFRKDHLSKLLIRLISITFTAYSSPSWSIWEWPMNKYEYSIWMQNTLLRIHLFLSLGPICNSAWTYLLVYWWAECVWGIYGREIGILLSSIFEHESAFLSRVRGLLVLYPSFLFFFNFDLIEIRDESSRERLLCIFGCLCSFTSVDCCPPMLPEVVWQQRWPYWCTTRDKGKDNWKKREPIRILRRKNCSMIWKDFFLYSFVKRGDRKEFKRLYPEYM